MNRAPYATSPLRRAQAQAQYDMPKQKSSRGHGAAPHTERKPFATSEAQYLAKDLNQARERIEELETALARIANPEREDAAAFTCPSDTPLPRHYEQFAADALAVEDSSGE